MIIAPYCCCQSVPGFGYKGIFGFAAGAEFSTGSEFYNTTPKTVVGIGDIDSPDYISPHTLLDPNDSKPPGIGIFYVDANGGITSRQYPTLPMYRYVRGEISNETGRTMTEQEFHPQLGALAKPWFNSVTDETFQRVDTGKLISITYSTTELTYVWQFETNSTTWGMLITLEQCQANSRGVLAAIKKQLPDESLFYERVTIRGKSFFDLTTVLPGVGFPGETPTEDVEYELCFSSNALGQIAAAVAAGKIPAEIINAYPTYTSEFATHNGVATKARRWNRAPWDQETIAVENANEGVNDPFKASSGWPLSYGKHYKTDPDSGVTTEFGFTSTHGSRLVSGEFCLGHSIETGCGSTGSQVDVVATELINEIGSGRCTGTHLSPGYFYFRRTGVTAANETSTVYSSNSNLGYSGALTTGGQSCCPP